MELTRLLNVTLFLSILLSTLAGKAEKPASTLKNIPSQAYIKSLCDSAEKYEKLNSDSCFKYGKLMMELTEHYEEGNPNKKLFIDSSAYKNYLLKAHYFMACDYGVKRIKKEMFSNYFAAYNLAHSVKNDEYLCKIGPNLGIELIIEGKPAGQDYLIEAKDLALSLGNKELIVKSQGALAFFYNQTKQYKKALEFLRSNQEMMDNGEVDYSVLTALSIGESYILLGRPDSALYFLEKSLNNYLALNLEAYTPSIRIFIGRAYLEMDQHVNAWGHLKLALATNKKYNQLVWPETYHFSGEAFHKMNILDSAASYYQKSIDQSIRVKTETIISSSYEKLAEVLAAQGKFKQAANAQDQHLKRYRQECKLQQENNIPNNSVAFKQMEQDDSISTAAPTVPDEPNFSNQKLNESSSKYGITKVIFYALLTAVFLFIAFTVRNFKNKRKSLIS